MPPTAKTPQVIVQEGIAALLHANAASLAVDQRTPTVTMQIPEKRFSSAKLPLICVDDVTEQSDEPWSGVRRLVLQVPMLFLDGVGGGSKGDKRAGIRQIELLAAKTKAFLQGANPHWNMEFLGLHVSMCTWNVGEARVATGANLLMVPMSIDVPVIVEKGKIWEV